MATARRLGDEVTARLDAAGLRRVERGEAAVPTRPPRSESALPARTVEWLEGRPPVERGFVHSVWERLAELERFGCPTGPIDALRSILLDHQPVTRSGRCHGCRRLSWCHRVVWRSHLIPVPRCRRFPCLVWSQIGVELLEHPAERGRHRRAADGDRRRARSPPGRAGDHQTLRSTGPGGTTSGERRRTHGGQAQQARAPHRVVPRPRRRGARPVEITPGRGHRRGTLIEHLNALPGRNRRARALRRGLLRAGPPGSLDHA